MKHVNYVIFILTPNDKLYFFETDSPLNANEVKTEKEDY